MKTLTKLTAQSCFVKQPNFGNDFLVCKRTDFHLFTETILFSLKFTDWILNPLFHYLFPSVTEDKINWFNKI